MWRDKRRAFEQQQRERETELQQQEAERRRQLYEPQQPKLDEKQQWAADVDQWRAARAQSPVDTCIKRDWGPLPAPTDPLEVLADGIGEAVGELVREVEQKLEARIVVLEGETADLRKG